MPPGHFNAIFIKDANKLLIESDSIAGIYEANKQGAFVFGIILIGLVRKTEEWMVLQN